MILKAVRMKNFSLFRSEPLLRRGLLEPFEFQPRWRHRGQSHALVGHQGEALLIHDAHIGKEPAEVVLVTVLRGDCLQFRFRLI